MSVVGVERSTRECVRGNKIMHSSLWFLQKCAVSVTAVFNACCELTSCVHDYV